jgi:hypothetical protein
MIEWGLDAALGAITTAALERIFRRARGTNRTRPVPPESAVAILAGNVFVAALEPMLMPLLVRAPVLVKASSIDDVFPRYLKTAIDYIDEALGACVQVVTFSRHEPAQLQAAIHDAEVVSVYGSDATIETVRQQLPSHSRLSPHGHGLSAIYVPATAIANKRERTAAIRRISLDIAAYDQRGCLSPHFICVAHGLYDEVVGFAQALCEQGLTAQQQTHPRGPLSTSALAAQMQWRGVAAARGRLFETDSFAVSYEGDAELRPSCGFRNIGVYDCADLAAFTERIAVFGEHLKAIGVVGPKTARDRVAQALPPQLAPRICRVGTMQTPPFDRFTDGRDPLHDLLRWIELPKSR